MLLNGEKRSINRSAKFLNNVNLPIEGKLLDLSCGDGKLLKLIKSQDKTNQLDLYGIDIVDHKFDSDIIKFHKTSSDQTQFLNQTFDVITCLMSLHHYKNINQTLAEVGRILQPQGQFYVLDIFPQNELSQIIYNSIRCHEPYHFEKFYTIDQFEELANQYSFNLITNNSISKIPKLNILKFVKQSNN